MDRSLERPPSPMHGRFGDCASKPSGQDEGALTGVSEIVPFLSIQLKRRARGHILSLFGPGICPPHDKHHRISLHFRCQSGCYVEGNEMTGMWRTDVDSRRISGQKPHGYEKRPHTTWSDVASQEATFLSSEKPHWPTLPTSANES